MVSFNLSLFKFNLYFSKIHRENYILKEKIKFYLDNFQIQFLRIPDKIFYLPLCTRVK